MKKGILFVDDEKQILRSLKRLFFNSEHNVYFADSGEQALEILERESIGIIISDMRMPSMNGYQLLKTTKEKYPTVLRLILSGYADESLVFKALSKNLAKLYLFKPWDNSELISVIDKIFETGKVLKRKNILDIMNNIENMPMRMNTYNELCNSINLDADMLTLVSIIEKDQVIAAKVLHIANSAFCGARIESISQATINLGLINISNIVLTASIFENIEIKNELSQYSEKIYDHACLCNKLSIILYKKLLKKNLLDIYSSSGLLHNIGQIFLLNNYTNEYLHILDCMKAKNNTSLIDLEMQAFSTTHQEIGGYLLDRWELPYPIVEAALFHLQPLNNNVVEKELVSIIHIADYISWEVMGYNKYNNMDMKVFDFLNTSLPECKNIIQKYI